MNKVPKTYSTIMVNTQELVVSKVFAMSRSLAYLKEKNSLLPSIYDPKHK